MSGMDVATVWQGDLRGDDVEHQQQHAGAADQADEGSECLLSEDESGQLSDVRLQERYCLLIGQYSQYCLLIPIPTSYWSII